MYWHSNLIALSRGFDQSSFESADLFIGKEGSSAVSLANSGATGASTQKVYSQWRR